MSTDTSTQPLTALAAGTAIVVGGEAGATAITVGVALLAVGAILAVAMRWGTHLSRMLGRAQA